MRDQHAQIFSLNTRAHNMFSRARARVRARARFPLNFGSTAIVNELIQHEGGDQGLAGIGHGHARGHGHGLGKIT